MALGNDIARTARKIEDYLIMTVGGIFGFGTGKALIRMDARVRDGLIKSKLLTDATMADYAGKAISGITYLSVLIYGYSRNDKMGDFAVGFGAGGLIDLATTVIKA